MAEEMMQDEKPKKKTVSVTDVLAKDKAPKAESKKSSASAGGKKKKMRHTHIEHHYDESGKESGHTIRHTPEGGGPEVSYTAPDMDGVHDGLEQHVGSENAGEGAGDQSAQAQPQSAPEPMAQPQPQQVGA